MEQLENELRSTRAELKTTVEELESANEELKSSNEELISTNEELQSANEELQTSKEELQSLNEELETVNTELRQKVDELGTANSDLQNLFAATEIATIFLDRSLRVAKFTPAATGAVPPDRRGRRAGHSPISRPASPARTSCLTRARSCGCWRPSSGRSGRPKAPGSSCASCPTGRSRTSSRAWSSPSSTSQRSSAPSRRPGNRRSSCTCRTTPSWSGRSAGRSNPGTAAPRSSTATAAEEAIGRVSYDLLATVFPRPRSEIEAELRQGGCWVGELQQRTKEGRAVTVLSNLQLARGEDGVDRVLEANRDITERKAAERRLAYLASFPENNLNPIVEADVEGRVRYANPAAAQLFPDLAALGAAHPWLADWQTTVDRLRTGSGGDAGARNVVVDDRTYHQTLYTLPMRASSARTASTSRSGSEPRRHARG